MRIRLIALMAAAAVLAAPMAALASVDTAPTRAQVRAEVQTRTNALADEPSQDVVRTRDHVRERDVPETDRPPVERIEHFIRTHPWLARWIQSLPCETDDCVPPRLQHWFRTHPAAAHWIFWYVRTHVI